MIERYKVKKEPDRYLFFANIMRMIIIVFGFINRERRRKEYKVKNKLISSTVAAMLLCVLWLWAVPGVQAAEQLQDGSYSINYTVLKAENDSVSMANDYWEKPAKVIVKNGELTVQMRLNHSQWVTQFKVPNTANKDEYIDTTLISSDKEADKRLVQFKATGLSEPLLSKIHVTVPEVDYDHDYTIRFSFDEKSIKTTEAAGTSQTAAKEQGTTASTAAASPSTSNGASEAAASAPSKSTASTQSAAKAVEAKASASAVQSSSADAKNSQIAQVQNPKTGDSNTTLWWIGALIISSLFMLSTVFISVKHHQD